MSAAENVLDMKSRSVKTRPNRIMVWLNDFIKRLFDIFVSGLFLLIFSPFYFLVAIAIKRDSPGPVFYRGVRIGRYGKSFQILKFRTMNEAPQSYIGPRITAHDDARITEVGHWLRETKINELPQFWNVLKGEMSLVGPRPEDPQFTKTWPKNIWNEVLSVRPGITSPASVKYHDEEKLLSNCDVEQQYLSELSPNKTRLDQLYIRYHSFLLDLDTLFWTALLFAPRLSSQRLPENLLFLGVFSRIIRRFLNWFTIDLLTALVTFSMTILIFRYYAPLNIGPLRVTVLLLFYAFLFSCMGVIFGINRIRWSKAGPTDYFDLVPAWILATTIAILSNIFIKFLPTELVLVGSVFSLFGFITIRSRTLILTHFLERSILFKKKAELMKERVLIIGLGASAQHTAWLFEHLTNSRLYHIVGFVDNDLLTQGARYFGSKVLGTWQDIPDLVKKQDIGLVILADYRVDSKGYQLIKDICSTTNTRLVVMPDILASINHLIKRTTKRQGSLSLLGSNMDSRCIDCLAQHSISPRAGSD